MQRVTRLSISVRRKHVILQLVCGRQVRIRFAVMPNSAMLLAASGVLDPVLTGPATALSSLVATTISLWLINAVR